MAWVCKIFVFLSFSDNRRRLNCGYLIKKKRLSSRQPQSQIVNLKSNTMKNTVQMYTISCYKT
ncbi:hypothetical protein D0T56_14275 [Dysgonomonas sp. 520]|nr:hypothetical protein [Dysgonomonas sp. 520]